MLYDRDKIFKRNVKLLRKYKEEHGDINVPVNYVVKGVKLGLWVFNLRQSKKGINGRKLSPEKEALFDSMGMVWYYRESVWNVRIELLKEYKEEHGDVNVPTDYVVSGIKLGKWVQRIRNVYKSMLEGNTKRKGKIKQKYLDILNDLGFVWDINENNWNECYKQFVDYVTGKEVEDEKRVKEWMTVQRMSKKENKLSEERTKKMDKYNFVWDSSEDLFNSRIELLKEYYKEHGDLDVPRKYVVDGIKLGNWVDGIRTARKGNGNYRLTDKEIEILDSCHMIWDLHEYRWNKNYEITKEYYELYGNINFKYSFVYKDLNIYTWLQTQKALYKDKKLEQSKVKKLNDLDLDWSYTDTKILNKEYDNFEKYNVILLKRMRNILEEIEFEGINEIDSIDTQKEIEKVIIKRTFR